MTRYANNRDKNERPIIDALREVGASVLPLHQPCDLLVGFHGSTYLLEVKSPPGPRGGKSKDGQKLNADQQRFADTWRGQFAVVTTPEEAKAAIGVGDE